MRILVVVVVVVVVVIVVVDPYESNVNYGLF